jgi:3-oxoacyl-[acyl-carrier protein] reductase
MQTLRGKIALVTGASRGIGRAVAEAFDTAGATVVGVARSRGCDVSREDDVEKLFADIRHRFDRLDILVNNAGILTPRKPMVEVTTEEWDESIAVNLRGVFLCTRAALRLMIPQRSGLIINVSSGAGKRAAPLWGA